MEVGAAQRLRESGGESGSEPNSLDSTCCPFQLYERPPWPKIPQLLNLTPCHRPSNLRKDSAVVSFYSFSLATRENFSILHVAPKKKALPQQQLRIEASSLLLFGGDADESVKYILREIRGLGNLVSSRRISYHYLFFSQCSMRSSRGWQWPGSGIQSSSICLVKFIGNRIMRGTFI